MLISTDCNYQKVPKFTGKSCLPRICFIELYSFRCFTSNAENFSRISHLISEFRNTLQNIHKYKHFCCKEFPSASHTIELIFKYFAPFASNGKTLTNGFEGAKASSICLTIKNIKYCKEYLRIVDKYFFFYSSLWQSFVLWKSIQ